MRVLLVSLLCLAACGDTNDLQKTPVYLGDFSLGHNVVVAPNLTKAPASRDATADEWIEALTDAVDDRFRRYDGTALYHFGLSIEAYLLAVPGVPLVVSPKSALSLRLTVWDDAEGRKLNSTPEVINLVESVSGKTIVGSGLLQSREEQMDNLVKQAAKQIENWLVQQNFENGWLEEDGVPLKEKPKGQDILSFLRRQERQKSDDQRAIEAAVAEALAQTPNGASRDGTENAELVLDSSGGS